MVFPVIKNMGNNWRPVDGQVGWVLESLITPGERYHHCLDCPTGLTEERLMSHEIKEAGLKCSKCGKPFIVSKEVIERIDD